ncbi:MAG TPA: type II toxin-antitoxin system RelE/ParE family toxin [Terriglobales bacterium]|nr:type II toxin-antitoxin system RelE/ParE family toxin [Terriglobales bacterium]
MKAARLTVSEAAAADIIEQADWYQQQSGAQLAKRWETAVTSAVLRIIDRPRAGTISKFPHSELSDVRRVLILGFPKHLIFYQVRKSEILILRIVHGARDLESLF